MTLAIKKTCPKCNSPLTEEYCWDDISLVETTCFYCGWRLTVEAPPLDRYDRDSYHLEVSDKQLQKIRLQLEGRV